MNTPEWNEYLKQFDLPCSHYNNIQLKSTKQCVIVEPRIHSHLIPVIKNFMYLLQNKGWGLTIFHGTDNEEFLKTNLEGWKQIKFININIQNLTKLEYSNLLCSQTFWKVLIHLNCEHALIFQVDTVLLKDSIDDFIQYDYIGAPWYQKWLGVLEVGNGGLSLRNTKKMLEITIKYPRTSFLENEDIYFSYWLLQDKSKVLPSFERAKEFSVETVYHNDTCGMHQPRIENFPDYAAFVKLLSNRITL